MNTNNIPLYFDKRYTITKVVGQQKYISHFCNIPLHSKPLTVESCIIRCKSHQTQQILRGLLKC